MSELREMTGITRTPEAEAILSLKADLVAARDALAIANRRLEAAEAQFRAAHAEAERLRESNKGLVDAVKLAGKTIERLTVPGAIPVFITHYHCPGQGNRRREAMTNLLEVIRKAHSARGDDHCIHDLDLIFEAAGLPIPPREVGDKAAMLRSCERFVTQLCTGGGDWPSYADLEKRIAELEAQLKSMTVCGCGRNLSQPMCRVCDNDE